LAVFSEIWYGPDALKVPSGNHTIEFKFNPSSYYKGERVSLICSLLLLVGCIFFFGKNEFETFKAAGSSSNTPVPKSKKKKG